MRRKCIIKDCHPFGDINTYEGFLIGVVSSGDESAGAVAIIEEAGSGALRTEEIYLGTITMIDGLEVEEEK